MAKLWIWKGSQYANVTQCSEYARICHDRVLDRVLNVSYVLNMPEFWVWQGSEYARVTQGSKYGWVCLNRTWICLNISEFTGIGRVLNVCHKIHSMYHAMHSAMSLCKVMST